MVRNDLHLLDEADLYCWQRDLLEELRGEPDERQIIWYYDSEGGSGKTAFARYLVGKCHGVLYLTNGAYKDASYQVIKAKTDPRIVCVNLPRTTEGRVSYATFESLKDGLVQCGKYEGGVRLFAPPHVVVFANFLPDLSALSMDRWAIRHLARNRRTDE